MKNILLKNSSLITHLGEVQTSRDILISEGKIVSVTTSSAVSSDKIDETEVIDCQNYFVTPGLVNLHTHAAMSIFRGIAEDVNSERWFNEMIWPYESQMTPDDIYVGTKLAIAEMISHGVTAFADHYFGEEQVLKAVLELGIRADLSPTVFGLADNYQQRLTATADFIEKHRQCSPTVQLRLGPHAPYTCPPPLLKEIVDVAKQLKTGIHLHVSETKEQVAASQAAYGRTPIGVLQESGAFELPLLLAHGLWITEQDLQYLTEQTYFAFCPKTYLKLAMGPGGFFKLRNRLNFGFGTDGAASSNTLNPVEQAMFFALLGKYQDQDAQSYVAQEIWRHLMSGHQALDFNTGRIEAGMAADLVIWDLFQIATYPVYDPVATILYSSNCQNVAYSIVHGKFLKYAGELCLDQAKLLNHVKQNQRALLKRGKGKAIVVY